MECKSHNHNRHYINAHYFCGYEQDRTGLGLTHGTWYFALERHKTVSRNISITSANMAAPIAGRNVIGWFQVIRNVANVSVARTTPLSAFRKQFNRLHYSIVHEAANPLTRATGPIVFRFCPHYSSSEIKQNCWKCKKEIDPKRDQYFCGCGLIQPPVEERNYFGVVNMEEDFNIDTKKMTQTFKWLQTQLHPDKFAQKSEVRKKLSTSISEKSLNPS